MKLYRLKYHTGTKEARTLAEALRKFFKGDNPDWVAFSSLEKAEEAAKEILLAYWKLRTVKLPETEGFERRLTGDTTFKRGENYLRLAADVQKRGAKVRSLRDVKIIDGKEYVYTEQGVEYSDWESEDPVYSPSIYLVELNYIVREFAYLKGQEK